ncbi:MAG: hypothetical protein JST35_07550 [Armatimonadetes bacterium]|nr:hypothetical protein [Armatimonadota bacterium]
MTGERGRTIKRGGISLLIATIVAGTCLAGPINVTFTPVFEGDSASPVRVTITNTGEGKQGEVYIEEGLYTRYPFDLPTGANKSIVVPTNQYGYRDDIKVRIGNQVFTEPPTGRQYERERDRRLAVISDEAFAFIRQNPSKPMTESNSVFAGTKPELAPDRTKAFDGYAGIVLDQGAERLNDAQVRAIQAHTLQGGTLIFIGGSSAAVLRDPRWKAFIGGSVSGTSNVKDKLLQSVPPVTFSATSVSRPKGISPLLNGYADYRTVGNGRVILYRMNPFEPGISGASISLATLMKAVILTQIAQSDQVTSPGRYGGTSSYANPYEEQSPYFGTTLNMARGGFQRAMIPVWIFAALLVPLAIIIPRKMKRDQLSWVLIPVIGFGITLYILRNQVGKSETSIQVISDANVFAQEGLADGVLLGRSMMFFPRAGQYDIGLPPVDQVWGGSYEDSFDGYPDSMGYGGAAGVSLVDNGKVQLGPVPTQNLTTRAIRYRAECPGAGTWIKVKKGAASEEYVITNTSPYDFQSVSIEYPVSGDSEESTAQTSGKLARGQSISIRLMNGGTGIPRVLCTLDGYNFGPQIGKRVTNVRFHFQLGGRLW